MNNGVRPDSRRGARIRQVHSLAFTGEPVKVGHLDIVRSDAEVVVKAEVVGKDCSDVRSRKGLRPAEGHGQARPIPGGR